MFGAILGELDALVIVLLGKAPTMRRLYFASLAYMITGVLSGLFYREFTKANDVHEGQFTQLGLVHTHLLTLGFIVLLIVLLLEKVFALSQHGKLFGWFFWLYNAGLIVTSGGLVWHGTLTVLGRESSAMTSGIAGLGHMLLTAGMVIFFIILGRSLKTTTLAATAAQRVEA